MHPLSAIYLNNEVGTNLGILFHRTTHTCADQNIFVNTIFAVSITEYKYIILLFKSEIHTLASLGGALFLLAIIESLSTRVAM